jgi:WD40 repeat protein
VFTARAENGILKEKLKKLEMKCRVLSIENESLKAEVEMYRKEAAMTESTTQGGDVATSTSVEDHSDHFVQSGNGVFAQVKEITLENLNGPMNISCCALSQDDTILATGGADQSLTLCQWGGAFSGKDVVQEAIHIPCDAPVISVDFARKARQPFVAAGCMDGSVRVMKYDTHEGLQAKDVAKGTIRHTRYVRTVAWASHDNLLASASADGVIQVHKVVWDGLTEIVRIEKVETLNLSGPVEALCFHKEKLICYARGTPHLLYFDLQDNFKQCKIDLNKGQTGYVAGFDEHVSYTVMDIAAFGDYLALATDTSRNIIIEFETGKQVRNLYGHKNDGFSQPKIAWSNNGHYIYGNTQDDNIVCVWDVSGSAIVKKLENAHTQAIRDLFSSHLTDTLVTTSFDKKTNLWFAPSE